MLQENIDEFWKAFRTQQKMDRLQADQSNACTPVDVEMEPEPGWVDVALDKALKKHAPIEAGDGSMTQPSRLATVAKQEIDENDKCDK